MPSICDTYAFAKNPKGFGSEQLIALVTDLIAERIVDRPCGLVVGHNTLPRSGSLLMSTDLDFETAPTGKKRKVEGKSLTLTQRGTRSAGLLKSLRAQELGKRDVMVWFRDFVRDKDGYPLGLDCDRPAYLWGILVCVLAKPKTFTLEDRKIQGQVYLHTMGEGGPWPEEVEDSKLDEVLRRHWGKTVVQGDNDF